MALDWSQCGAVESIPAICRANRRSARTPFLMLILFDNGTPRTLARFLMHG
jgi:hypothetical protein